MKFFDRFKKKTKKTQEQNVFQQDLSSPEQPGVVFIMNGLQRQGRNAHGLPGSTR